MPARSDRRGPREIPDLSARPALWVRMGRLELSGPRAIKGKPDLQVRAGPDDDDDDDDDDVVGVVDVTEMLMMMTQSVDVMKC